MKEKLKAIKTKQELYAFIAAASNKELLDACIACPIGFKTRAALVAYIKETLCFETPKEFREELEAYFEGCAFYLLHDCRYPWS